MPDTYISQFSGEEIDAALRAAQIISGADTPAELRKKLEIRGDTIPVSATDPTPVSEALTTSGGGINPNLLDNWFFGRPVNQKGQMEYTVGFEYTIDRWKSNYENKLTVSDGCIHPIGPNDLSQFFDSDLCKSLVGKTVSCSVLYKNTNGVIHSSAGDLSNTTDNWELATRRFIWSTSNTSFYVFQGGNPNSSSCDILAAKLELGDTQTLAHKENEKWVLNEIPDFGEQLRRCQWYCRVYKAGTTLPCLAYPQMDGGWYASAGLPTNGMRTIPTNNLGDGKKVAITDLDGADATHDDMSMLNWGQNENMLCLRISGGSHGGLTSKFPYWIKLKEDLILSADL